jgi:SOS-response transcriptional repressor LexA
MAKPYLKLSSILKKLLYERHMHSTDLAQAVNLPQPTIHRLVTGKSTRPYLSSLEPIAQYFSIEVAQLIGEKPLPFSTTLLDQITQVPFMSWKNIVTQEIDVNHPPIPFIGSISKKCFATAMPDVSMEPLIPHGSLLILDPELVANDRSYILVRLQEENQMVLRELLIDGDHQFLKPLNSHFTSFKMQLLNKDDEVLACLVEIRHNCHPVDKTLK